MPDPTQTELRHLLAEVADRLPAEDAAGIGRLIGDGEPGVALEHLCTQLHEYDARISRSVFDRIKGLAGAMGMSPSVWEFLGGSVQD